MSNQPAKTTAFIDRLGETACAIKALQIANVKHEGGNRFPLTTTLPKGYPLHKYTYVGKILELYYV